MYTQMESLPNDFFLYQWRQLLSRCPEVNQIPTSTPRLKTSWSVQTPESFWPWPFSGQWITRLAQSKSMRSLTNLGILTSSFLRCPASRSALFITQQGLRSQRSSAELLIPHTSGHVASRSTLSKSPPSTATPCSNSTFSYRIGASFSAKGRRFNPKKDVFAFNTQTQTASEQDVFTGRPNSGQDAFFVSRAGNSSKNVAFGVADGVGGWADQGIDSADFSHGLCQGMAKVAREYHSPHSKELLPRSILGSAYQDLVRHGNIDGGGSTACIATGNEEGILRVAK